MLRDAVLVGLIGGFLLGGRLSRLAEVEFKGVAPVLAALAIQLGAQWGLDAGWRAFEAAAPVLFTASFLLLLWVIRLNRRSPAVVVMGVGILLNTLVIALNGGRMPVSAEAMERAGLGAFQGELASGATLKHALLDAGTRLPWLADIFAWRPPYLRPRVFSVGDVVLSVGAIAFIVRGMKRGE